MSTKASHELSHEELKDMCGKLDLEGMMKHKERFIEHFRRDTGDRNDSIYEMFATANEMERFPRLIEIFKFLVDGPDEDERFDIMCAFVHDALFWGATDILDYLETSDARRRHLVNPRVVSIFVSDAIKSGHHVCISAIDWVVERDPSLLKYMYQQRVRDGFLGDELEEMETFLELMFENGYSDGNVSTKHRKELVQKIGSILDENTSVLKEQDYRVCMDTLMELM